MVQLANSLFIWATTAYRFIQEVKKVSIIRGRLAAILQANSSIAENEPERYLDEIYIIVLRCSIPEKYSNKEKEKLLNILRDILGYIVTLLSPLSV